MIASACFPELPVQPKPSKHLLPSRQSFSKEGVRRMISCFRLLLPRQGDLQGNTALTQLPIMDMHLAMWNLEIRNQPKILICFCFYIKNWHSALPLQQAVPRWDKRVLCIPPCSVHSRCIYHRPHADCTAKSSSVFLLKILVMFLWGTHTPSGRQMESQSVEKKQTQINNYSPICVL